MTRKKKQPPKALPEPEEERKVASKSEQIVKEGGVTHASALNKTSTIPRNLLWQYHSAYDGPWTNLRLDHFENLVQNHLKTGPPFLTHPAVVRDLLTIRRLIDEASDLAVRAQNGTTLSNTGASTALGLRTHPGFDFAKLSPERKHRLREAATQRLSEAYQLNELATCTAVMHSASVLTDVARLVLQRNPASNEAKYVQFFHEKVPSQATLPHTPLTPLDEVLASDAASAAIQGTRATGRAFNGDYLGAAQDLTIALRMLRQDKTLQAALEKDVTFREKAEQHDLCTRKSTQVSTQHHAESGEGSSAELEMRFLFHRGTRYLDCACLYIRQALRAFHEDPSTTSGIPSVSTQEGSDEAPTADQNPISHLIKLRGLIRKYTKSALKDYDKFLSHLHYTCHSAQKEDAGRNAVVAAEVANSSSSTHFDRPMKISSIDRRQAHDHVSYSLSEVISLSPPSGFPFHSSSPGTDDTPQLTPPTDQQVEKVTFHPLLDEALYSVMLGHAILQTPHKAMLRIAKNVAHTSQLMDGHPFFTTSQCYSRKQWLQVIKHAQRWLGISNISESQCPDSDHGREKDSDRPLIEHDKQHVTDLMHAALGVTSSSLQGLLDGQTASPDSNGQKYPGQDSVKSAAASGDDYASDHSRGVVSGLPNSANRKAVTEAPPTNHKTNGSSIVTDKSEANAKRYLLGPWRADLVATWYRDARLIAEVCSVSCKERKKAANPPKDEMA
ncbi:MAG: hypothetical protein M1828_006409 [Chrysothrix sp. TS-e1954]|nr:MAG: hypothetical protein M1828_006409 [Chrysothrix sp. TS-e1954]